MKLTIKVALVISLFTSVALADGEMGNGGFTGEMGNGGKTCTASNCVTEPQTNDAEQTVNEQDDSIFVFIKEYLDSLFM